MGLSNKLSYEAESVSHSCNPHRFFQSEVLRLYFPTLGPWVAWPVLLPSYSSQFICMQIWDHPVSQPSPHSVFQPLPCPPQSSRPHLAMSPLHPGCPSPPLLSIWMNVSSLSPWLSNFHTVQFSGSSGCFLFLNLLSFFWLCEEAKCIYLCLHLGWKSCSFPIFVSRGKGAFFSKICPLFNQAF